MTQALDRLLTKRAQQHLCRTDPVMSRLVKTHGPCPLAMRKYQPFDTLVGSIVSQQLSAKAASTIKARISEIVGAPFTPSELLSVKTEHLRAAGLSGSKIRYVRELAQRVVSGRLLFDDLELQESELVIAKLVEIPGIGRWTAEMFLIFGLKRPDVLAIHDAGLQRAARLLYGGGSRIDMILEEVSEAWRPYRSVASWYLWRHLDSGG